LAAYPALAGPRQDALLLLGGAAVLVMAVALGLGVIAALPWAIALLAVDFVVSLLVRDASASFVAAGYGAALLLVAEVGYRSLRLRLPSRRAPGLLRRGVVVIAGLVIASLAVAAVAAALAGAPVPGSLPLLAAGTGAVVAAIGIVLVLLWQPSLGRAERPRQRGLRPEDRAG
jgi:hypothetical protein